LVAGNTFNRNGAASPIGLDSIAFSGKAAGMNMQPPSRFSANPAQMPVAFDRREMSQILSVYGRMVAAGEWRDYGIFRSFGALRNIRFTGSRKIRACDPNKGCIQLLGWMVAS
jgi:hypothetical protein